jgi:hypothetical protein
MLKFANVALEFLLEFGMRYRCLSLAIDKCRLLICCRIFFKNIFYEYESSFLLLFDSILYIVYCEVYAVYYI